MICRQPALFCSSFLLLTTSFVSAYAAEEEPSNGRSIWMSTEVAAVWQSRNDIEIPKGDATRFSLLDLGKGPFLAGRIYAGIRFGDLHEVRALYAPFVVTASGKLGQTTRYMGKTFSSEKETEALFRFNSYRLTYRYTLADESTWNVKVGFTGKIRDAEIRLSQGKTEASRSNVGFVPLLHLAAEYRPVEAVHLVFDADALAAPQGRAEDVALTVGYDIAPNVQVYGGYRTVEGGSNGGNQDNRDSVYNFTWLHAALVGTTVRF
jgi:hypothetical protein